eukprot:scaffold55250_cov34-Tisochrysis_lutea.AAC.2
MNSLSWLTVSSIPVALPLPHDRMLLFNCKKLRMPMLYMQYLGFVISLATIVKPIWSWGARRAAPLPSPLAANPAEMDDPLMDTSMPSKRPRHDDPPSEVHTSATARHSHNT